MTDADAKPSRLRRTGEICLVALAACALVGCLPDDHTGGIRSALAAAVRLNAINVGLVTLAQLLRLLAMVIVAPRLIRRLTRARHAPAARLVRRRLTDRRRDQCASVSESGSSAMAVAMLSARPVAAVRAE
jgi:hypothetical protein